MARTALCTATALLALLLAPAAAAADEGLPPGSISATAAKAAADRDSKVVAERREHPDLSSSANVVDGHWEVAYFSGGDELALVLVDPRSAEVEESWTGYQVAWKMARGYSGAFGHKLNAPYVFLPLCAIFLIGLVDWRHRRRVANLDLLVLIGFGVSNFFFNRAEIGVSVPIVYPLLLYLFGRALWIGIRGRGMGVRPVWPATWLLIAALFLVGFRVGLNVADSGAIDVGYASVVGADRIAHGEQLYDNFPEDVSQGDTYGPVNYYAYVPSERIWPWSGSWDDLPAAHGAAVLFDLATFALLFLLGRRLRAGPAGYDLGATVAFGWAAFPYTAYVLESNSNDALVSLFLVATLLALSRPMLRGALASLAVFTKFAPLILVPMLATYSPSAGGADDRGVEDSLARSAPRSSVTGPAVVRFVLAFIGISIVVMLWPAINPGLHTFYERTIAYQADRNSPFSIWGQVGLEPLRLAILAIVGALSLAFAFYPRRKNITQVAALGAALLIGLQITAEHWFYLYIVWFYPLLLVAMATVGEGGRGTPTSPIKRRQGLKQRVRESSLGRWSWRDQKRQYPRPPPSPRRPPPPSRSGPASGS
jgi:hypothetical protein